jgi:hypothetical protein
MVFWQTVMQVFYSPLHFIGPASADRPASRETATAAV